MASRKISLGPTLAQERRAMQRLLKRAAMDKCEGCRLSWRIQDGRHREPMPIECEAKDIRDALRKLNGDTQP